LASITGGHCLCPSDRQGKAVNMRRGSAGYGPLWFDKFWRFRIGWDWLRAVRFVMAVLVRFGVFSSGPAGIGSVCCGEHGGRSCGFPTNLN